METQKIVNLINNTENEYSKSLIVNQKVTTHMKTQ